MKIIAQGERRRELTVAKNGKYLRNRLKRRRPIINIGRGDELASLTDIETDVLVTPTTTLIPVSQDPKI